MHVNVLIDISERRSPREPNSTPSDQSALFEAQNTMAVLTWLLHHGGWRGLHHLKDGAGRLGQGRGGAWDPRGSHGVGGGGGSRCALGDRQRGPDGGELQRGHAGRRGDGQGGHRPALLASGLAHDDLHDARAAHHGGGHWEGEKRGTREEQHDSNHVDALSLGGTGAVR